MLQRKIQQLTYFKHFFHFQKTWQLIDFFSNCLQTWSFQFQIFFPFAFLVQKKIYIIYNHKSIKQTNTQTKPVKNQEEFNCMC